MVYVVHTMYNIYRSGDRIHGKNQEDNSSGVVLMGLMDWEKCQLGSFGNIIIDRILCFKPNPSVLPRAWITN